MSSVDTREQLTSCNNDDNECRICPDALRMRMLSPQPIRRQLPDAKQQQHSVQLPYFVQY